MHNELLFDAVAAMDGELQRAAAPAGTELSGLTTAWGRVVQLLDLQQHRPTRSCPRCGHSGMREATRCGYCWGELTPPPRAEPRAER